MNRFAMSVFLGMAVVIEIAWLAVPGTRADQTPALAQAAKKVKEIIGHRGSCGDRPENTLTSYRRAIEVGATVAALFPAIRAPYNN